MATRSEGAPRAGAAAAMMVANNALGMLQQIVDALDGIRSAVDEEVIIDTTFVVGGTLAAAAVQQIQLPRTVHHAEIELSVGTSTPNVFAAVFSGAVSVNDAGNRHNPAAGGSPSGAIVASNGNSVTARDNLDETGILTVYFTGAATIYANVRVRVLDKTQARSRRT